MSRLMRAPSVIVAVALALAGAGAVVAGRLNARSSFDGLLHGNLGLSFSLYPATVSSVIGAALPWTLFLVGLAALISFFLGTGLGVLAAWRGGGFLDSVLPPLPRRRAMFPAARGRRPRR